MRNVDLCWYAHEANDGHHLPLTAGHNVAGAGSHSDTTNAAAVLATAGSSRKQFLLQLLQCPHWDGAVSVTKCCLHTCAVHACFIELT
jgi:hypothetical protein